MALKMIGKPLFVSEKTNELIKKFTPKMPIGDVVVDMSSKPDESVMTVGVITSQEEKIIVHEKVPLFHELTETEAMTQEYLHLYKFYEDFEMKKTIARMEVVKKSLQSIANSTMDGKKPAIFKCPDGEVEFSARGEVTDVPNPAELIAFLEDKFGTKAAFSCVKIGITELKKMLTEYEMKKFIEKKDGSRTLTSVRPA